MPLDADTLAKLTTTLASDIELYNKVITEVQQNDAAIEEKDKEIQATKTKLDETEVRAKGYLEQVANLLSKLPVATNSNTPQSLDQKIEEIKNRSWDKTK